MTDEFKRSLKKEFRKDIFGIILFPALITIFCVIIFFLFLIPTIQICKDGGNIQYNDSAAVKYRDEEFAKYFSDTSNEKNGLLIVYLVEDKDDKYDQFFCISKAGENINDKINAEFGNNESSFGKAVLSSIDDKYKNSFSGDIASVMETMTKKIDELSLSSSFKDATVSSDTSVSRVINYTPLAISDETVNKALEDFASETDIPVIIVIDSIDKIFERELPFKDFLIMAVLIGVAVFCIYNTTKKVILRVRYEYHPELFVKKSIYDKDDEEDAPSAPVSAESTEKTDEE